MPDTLKITPARGPVVGSIRPPGSKSITNRALICAALAEGPSTLTGALDSEDTRVMIAALEKLGVKVRVEDGGRTLHVAGCGGAIPASRADLFVANSGTSMRFLTAMVAIGQGEFRLDGVPRMRERPIGDLVAAMRSLGVSIDCEGLNNCPPVVVHASGLKGGHATIRGNVSSQFLSGLLLAAPYAERSIDLTVEGELVSKPYLWMTQRVMKKFRGRVVASDNFERVEVSNVDRYFGQNYPIEPDASAASYFLAAGAIAGGAVTVEGLGRFSLQGDVAFADCLEQMGARVTYGTDSITVEGRPLAGIDVDMNAISDTVPTLAVAALFAEGPTRIRNVAHIRHKETDRIAAVATELRKLGADVDEFGDGLLIRPHALRGATIDTYDDHRMAMSFALAGLKSPGVVIRDPGCTAKTYPNFFADLAELTRQQP
jgi:3-phosphoshikimate 1-carboxyvinyltransferase